MSYHPLPVFARQEVIAMTSRPLSRRFYTISLVLFVIGALTFIIGLFVSPDRVWHAWHANWLFFTGLSSAGCTFVAVQRITTARWSREVIRFMEGYVAFLPVAFVFLVITVLLGKNHVFPWAHEPYPVPEKALYFGPVFFSVRVLVIFGLITALSLWYMYTSLRLDVGMNPEWDGARLTADAANDRRRFGAGLRARMRGGFRDERREIHSTHSLQGKLAVFMVLAFAYGWSVLSWDLSMGLSLHFQSTLYGWWFFMGAWVAALASWSLIVMAWRRYLARYDLIQDKHFHDLGKLCFAFTAFWGYITFGQYLVIWYGNVAEETHWARLRLIEGWRWPTLVTIGLMFVLPFFGLLSRAAKVFLPTLVFFTTCIVVGLWMTRYLEVYPSIYGELHNIPFGLWEIAITLGVLGIWAYCYLAFSNAFPRMRILLMTSPYRDEVQVPVNPRTMEPLPAHE
jgi:uncharacterized membrane protein YiaA